PLAYFLSTRSLGACSPNSSLAQSIKGIIRDIIFSTQPGCTRAFHLLLWRQDLPLPYRATSIGRIRGQWLPTYQLCVALKFPHAIPSSMGLMLASLRR